MKQGTKVIFQTEHDDSRGEAGAELFAIELENFEFSDFYAEIKFVNISNVAPSFSDFLKISGTLLGDDDENRKITVHQLEWADGSTPLTEEVLVHLKGNKVFFWGKYNGTASGYLYQIDVLTSRALHNSVKFEKISEGFLYDCTMKPTDAVLGSTFRKQ